MSLLPWVDEHVVVVDAGVDEVWSRLLVKVGRSLSTAGGARYARVVGAVPRETGGVRPLGVGSEFPGFRVARLVPGRELALEGRHRFSSYSLVFRVEETADGRCRLRAETRAVFPGAAGRVYRALVIGSGGHAFAMRRLLAGYRQP
ncbi:hypothetical protein [Streptomyces sp. NPDC056480]|uniref:hypothetical protein n=1 Tax=Streptomyces sp. NPDC056480 TaxID=3345833 RepID=UPI003673AAE5